MGVVLSGMFYFLSKFGKRNRWTVESTLCSIGLLSQFGFTSMVSIAIVPFVCYTHPVGSQSVMSYPEVMCNSTGTYESLVAFSMIMFTTIICVMALILSIM